MSLSLLPTLEEIRNSIVVRCGLANSGTLPVKQQRWIDEEIRRAQRELWSAYHWLRRSASVQIPMSAGVARYDLPNVFQLGGIHRVGLLATDGKVHELRHDDLIDIRNQYRHPGKPRYWKVTGTTVAAAAVPPLPATTDLYLEVTPAPTSEWTALVVEGVLRDYPVEQDTDRVVLDGEAIVQLVTIRYREYMGLGGDQGRNRADFTVYLDNLRGLEAPTMMYPQASRKVDGPAYWNYPSNAGSFQPYAPTWTPW